MGRLPRSAHGAGEQDAARGKSWVSKLERDIARLYLETVTDASRRLGGMQRVDRSRQSTSLLLTTGKGAIYEVEHVTVPSKVMFSAEWKDREDSQTPPTRQRRTLVRSKSS